MFAFHWGTNTPKPYKIRAHPQSVNVVKLLAAAAAAAAVVVVVVVVVVIVVVVVVVAKVTD